MHKHFIVLLAAAMAALLVMACSPSEVTTPWGGESIDLLQEDSSVTISPNGEKAINVAIQLKNGETCKGSFTEYDRRSGIPLFMGAQKSYEGSWDTVSGKGCQDAIGSSGGVQQYVVIDDPTLSFMGSTLMRVCNMDSSRDVCLAKNTFKVEPKEM